MPQEERPVYILMKKAGVSVCYYNILRNGCIYPEPDIFTDGEKVLRQVILRSAAMMIAANYPCNSLNNNILGYLMIRMI
ncbi:hypothetical protein ACFL6I_13535 [candidate division KSB1 bacterium]